MSDQKSETSFADAFDRVVPFIKHSLAASLSTNNIVGPVWRYDYDWANYPSTAEYLMLLLSGVGAVADSGLYGQAYATMRYGVVNGYSWLKDTQCAVEMGDQAMNLDKSPCNYPHDAGISCNGPSASGETCDTGWCSDLEFSPANDEPSGCSNSTSFASKNTIISSLVFNNGTPGSVLGPFAVFASVTLTVTPSFSQDTGSDVETYKLAFPTDSALTTAMNKSTWPEHTAMSSYENGSISCAAGTGASGAGTYGYGASSSRNTPSTTGPGSLSAKDTLHFQLCRLHQQLQKCRADALNICTDGINCCDIFQKSQSGCWPDTWLFCSPYTSTGYTSPVFRPFAQYFEVALGADNALCERSGDDDLRSCLVFNGRVRALDTNGGSLFTFEPNAFKDPRLFESGGPVLGVPVEFSLLFSADGSDPSTGSYLAQFCSAADPSSATGATAVTYGTQRGFLALGAFWTRLNTMVLPTTDTTAAVAGTTSASGSASAADENYAKFCRAYFVYAVTNRFLLSLYQLAPLASGSGITSGPLALFQTSQQWTRYTAGVWASVATTYSASEFLPGLASSELFTGAQPLVGAVDSDGNISVTLTVPSLLLSWSPAALLLAAFPFTPSTFNLPVHFDPATAFQLILGNIGTTGSVTAATTATSATNNPFSVIGPVSVQYYTVDYNTTMSTGYVVPAANTDTNDSLDTAIVAAKMSFTVKAAPGSMTLLFYLYYVHSHGTGTFSAEAAAELLATGEPAVVPVPTFLDWSVACSLASSTQCLASGYTGVGASVVNALFLNSQAAVCQCVRPANSIAGLTSEATLNPSAMCFNSFCRSTAQTTVDRNSLIAGALAGTSCAARATAPSLTTEASLTPPATETATATAMCKSLCPEYLSVLDNASVDAGVIDAVALRDECGVDLTSSATATVATAPAAAACCAMLFACVPIFFLASLMASAALAAKSTNTTTSASHASSASAAVPTLPPLRPAFYVPALVVFVLCCAAAVYAWVDLRGTATCAGGAVLLNDGYDFPASACMSNGFASKAAAVVGLTVPLFKLPASFCQAPISYCQCNNSATYGQNISCATSSCGCSGAACCSTNGICTAEATATEPYAGRAIKLYEHDTRFDPLMGAVCCAAALCVVPACVAAMWLGTPAFALKPAAAVAIAFIILCLCAVPLAVQALDSSRYRRYDVGVGTCVRLTEYPAAIALTDQSSITYTMQLDTGSSVPYYTLDSATSTAPATLSYSSTASAFTSSAAPVTGTVYVNDTSSSVVFAGVPATQTAPTLPPLYAMFRSSDGTFAFSVCGTSATGTTTCAT